MHDQQASDAADQAPADAGTTAHTLVEHPVNHDQQASEAVNEHRPHEGETANHEVDDVLQRVASVEAALAEFGNHDIIGRLVKLEETVAQLADQSAQIHQAIAADGPLATVFKGVNDRLDELQSALETMPHDGGKLAETVEALRKRVHAIGL